MLTTYFVVSSIFTVIAIMATVASVVEWLDVRSSGRPVARKEARVALVATALVPLSWTWPLTVPLALLYLILRLVRDAFPDAFKLKRNQTKE